MSKFYKISEHTLTNIADVMRMWTNKTDKITPDEMPQEVDAVFNAGADIGYTTGYNHGKRDGSDEGRQAEYDAFWDAAQDYGRRTGYPYGFCSYIWNDVTFRPKYDIRPEGNATSMFRYSQITDLVSILEEQGVVLDLSKATVIEYAFNNCTTRRLGVIDCTSASSARSLFNAAGNLEEIELFRVTEKLEYNGTFNNAAKLENLTVDGVIGKNGFDIHWSTGLSKASIESIVNAASTTASITITLPRVAVQREFETSEGANDGNTSQEWLDLVATRPTVTFALS